MIPLNYLIAIALITQPGESKLFDSNIQALPYVHLMPIVQEISYKLEILDKRENNYLLKYREEFGSDLSYMRNRYKDMLYCPCSNDSDIFPDLQLINLMLAQNRDYRLILVALQEFEPRLWFDYREQIMEVDKLYKIYDYVRDSKADYYYITYHRMVLNKLREAIGYQDFYAGVLPPHLPIWHFKDIK